MNFVSETFNNFATPFNEFPFYPMFWVKLDLISCIVWSCAYIAPPFWAEFREKIDELTNRIALGISDLK